MRLRKILTVCIGASMILLLWGGAIRFPDAPIKECPPGYCGKGSGEHARDDYRLFQIWETTLWIYWPIGILILALLNWKNFRDR